MKNVGERAVQFADVVEQCDSFNAAQCMLVEAGGVAENQGVGRDTTHVFACILVIGINGIEQRLHRRRTQTLGARARGMLVVEDATGRHSD